MSRQVASRSRVLGRPRSSGSAACSTASGTGVRLVGKGRATSNTAEPRVRLLGGFAVAVGDNVVADRAWRLRKAKALVKILALAPDRRMHRERLAESLWPDRDAHAAANNLNQAPYAAPRALDSVGADGAATVVLIDGAVVLEAQVDVDAFEAAATSARADRDWAAYVRALEVHSGAMLPEDRYEPWADARRAALTELHTALCIELAELRGDAPAAVVALQRALVADPLAEPAHRALMRVYARTGRRQQALAQYQLLRQSLSAELAAGPLSDGDGVAEVGRLRRLHSGMCYALGSGKAQKLHAAAVPVAPEGNPFHPHQPTADVPDQAPPDDDEPIRL